MMWAKVSVTSIGSDKFNMFEANKIVPKWKLQTRLFDTFIIEKEKVSLAIHYLLIILCVEIKS